MRAVALFLLLTGLALAGCVGPVEPLPPPPETPDGPAPAPPDPSGLHAALSDARARPLDPTRLRLVVTIDGPVPDPLDLAVRWTSKDETLHDTHLVLAPNTTRVEHIERVDLSPGRHHVVAHVGTTDATTTATIDLVVWAPIRLVLNASQEYAGDQNPFHGDHWIPFAPWVPENALDILTRAATTYGFTTKTDHRSDLESSFVAAINGTAFRWDVEAAGISRNWMILVEGHVEPNAVDDAYPAPDQTLEFRYVRCYATGHCDDL